MRQKSWVLSSNFQSTIRSLFNAHCFCENLLSNALKRTETDKTSAAQSMSVPTLPRIVSPAMKKHLKVEPAASVGEDELKIRFTDEAGRSYFKLGLGVNYIT